MERTGADIAAIEADAKLSETRASGTKAEDTMVEPPWLQEAESSLIMSLPEEEQPEWQQRFEAHRQQQQEEEEARRKRQACLLYTSPSPRDRQKSRMPSSA